MLPGAATTPENDSPQKDKTEEKAADDKQTRVRLISEILQSVKLAKKSNRGDEASENQEIKKEWMMHFLEKKEFEFSYSLLHKYQSTENSFQQIFLGFILKILRIFITAAFMATEPEDFDTTDSQIPQLIKQESSTAAEKDVTKNII